MATLYEIKRTRYRKKLYHWSIVYPVGGKLEMSVTVMFQTHSQINYNILTPSQFGCMDVGWTPTLRQSSLMVSPHLLRGEVLAFFKGYMDQLALMSGLGIGFLRTPSKPISNESTHYVTAIITPHITILPVPRWFCRTSTHNCITAHRCVIRKN